VSDGKSLKVTCSLGLASFSGDDDAARLIRRADDALYASKKAGRNCGHWNTGVKHVPITSPEEGEDEVAAIEAVDTKTEQTSSDEIATTPEAPGAPSGATFVQMLKRRVTESHRFGIPISVLYLKIADYDIVNRKHGGTIARQLTDAAGPAIQRALREMDVLTKLEGGEFVVMLPGSAQGETNHLFKRIGASAANCVLPVLDRELRIRFQHGVAELRTNETAQELLARARQALTAAAVPQPVAAPDR
jgi:diguanylate cyclase